jgi:hypothetical protein
MELVDTLLLQGAHLLDGDARRDHLARLGIIVEAVEALGEPGGHRGAALFREALQLGKARDRQDAGDDNRLDARGRAAIAEAQVDIDVEKELGDRA